MKFSRLVVLVSCLAVAAPLALAQPEPGRPGPPSWGPRGGGPMHGMGPGRMGPMGDLGSQDVRELVETVMLARMSRELELDDEQAVLLIRRFEDTKERIAELSEERSEAMEELRASIRDEEAEGVIGEKFERLVGLDTELAEAKLKAVTEVGEGFTVTQRAKLYVFVQEFDGEMRGLVDRARKRHRGMGPPEGMGMPEDMRQEFRDGMRQPRGGSGGRGTFGGQGGGGRNHSGRGGAIGSGGPPESPPPPPPPERE